MNMYEMTDVLNVILAIWICIILFVTVPLWIVPYFIYSALRRK